MAIAGSPGIPSSGFYIRNRKLLQVGTVANKPADVIVAAVDAAAMLLFDPGTPVQMDVRRGTSEAALRLYLTEMDLID